MAVSSSQDDRGFTQDGESFTTTPSSSFMRNVATSANALRHDYFLHARRIFRDGQLTCMLFTPLTPSSSVSGRMQSFLHDASNDTTNTFVTRAALSPARTHPLAHFATILPVSKPQTLAFAAVFAGPAHHLQASYRHTSTLAQLFPAVTSSSLSISAGFVFRVLVHFRFLTQAARGFPYTEARFHWRPCSIAMQND